MLNMQASLADEETQVPGNALVPTWLSAAQSGLASASAQQGTGLRNATGEYNCFLNVIIQCLWHCASFRHAVMQWPKAVYQVSKHRMAAADMTCRPQWMLCLLPCLKQAKRHSIPRIPTYDSPPHQHLTWEPKGSLMCQTETLANQAQAKHQLSYLCTLQFSKYHSLWS